MTPAVLAALAVWCWVGPPAGRRARVVWPPPRGDRRPVDTALLGMLLAPLVGALLLGWPIGAVAGALAAPFVKGLLDRFETAAERRRTERLQVQLPGTLDLVCAALEAGRPPGGAMSLAASVVDEPMRSDLGAIARRLEISGDLQQSLVGAPPGLAGLARALRRSDSSGAPTGAVVAAVADDARRQRRGARREAARRVGVATAAPLGLCFLPAFFCVGIVPTVAAMAGSLLP